VRPECLSPGARPSRVGTPPEIERVQPVALPRVTLARCGCGGVEHFNGHFDGTVERPGRDQCAVPRRLTRLDDPVQIVARCGYRDSAVLYRVAAVGDVEDIGRTHGGDRPPLNSCLRQLR
jgi:hypothetical protein